MRDIRVPMGSLTPTLQAYYRRACAQIGLGKVKEAKDDFEKARRTSTRPQKLTPALTAVHQAGPVQPRS